jgi:hypothetical protein
MSKALRVITVVLLVFAAMHSGGVGFIKFGAGAIGQIFVPDKPPADVKDPHWSSERIDEAKGQLTTLLITGAAFLLLAFFQIVSAILVIVQRTPLLVALTGGFGMVAAVENAADILGKKTEEALAWTALAPSGVAALAGMLALTFGIVSLLAKRRAPALAPMSIGG